MMKKLTYKLKKFFFRNIKDYELNLDELKEKQLEGAEIIDVRNVSEYNEGHLEGSINIPENTINDSFENIIKDKSKTIVLYCTSGYRSSKAYDKLKKMGYLNIFTLYGGMQNY